MDYLQTHHVEAAVLLVRLFLGVLFAFQGYDALFGVGLKNVQQTYLEAFTMKGVPRQLIALAAWYTSWSELLCGILLVLGLFYYPALFLLALNLLIAAVGFGMHTAMWDTRHVFPRLVLLTFLLCVPPAWNVFLVDSILF